MRRRVLTAAAFALSIAALPAAQSTIPTPRAVIGWEPCADYKLATYEQIEHYFRTLAAAAPARMQLVDMGPTTEGRRQVMGIISSEQNIRALPRYKSIARALALARDGERPLTDAAARTLAHEGKAVVWVDFGLHSIEVAHAQTAPLMAFTAVADDSEEMRFIRDNVIFLLVANMNPDGTTMVADWYRDHRGMPWESRLPELWHKYAGHDNNRDWFMMTQVETRNSARQLYAEWFPQIVYNQHQTGPFPSRIFVPPFDDPMNPNIPPLVMRGVNLIGEAMTRRLDREGKRGAISHVGFDTWWNGGMRTAPYFHNMIGLLTETAHASATPARYDAAEFPRAFDNGLPTLAPTTFYPSPYHGGEWHLRDSCNYMVTTSMAVLDAAARRREEWLYDIYQMGRDAIREHADETFVVSADQWDPGTAVKMINVLRLGGVGVEQATAQFSANGKAYPKGSFVIRGAQPFEPYVRDLLTPQVYPDMRQYPGGPPKRPYDITGWTLNYQMGVAVDRILGAVVAPSTTTPVDLAPPPTGYYPGAVGGQWLSLALDPRANDSFVAVNRLLKAGARVYRSPSAVPVNRAGQREDWPPGTFVVPRGETPPDFDWIGIVHSLGLKIANTDRPSNAWAIRPRRIGVYHGWGGNMDEGWTRWILEQFEFRYASVYDHDVRAGALRERFDVILLPDATAAQMQNGLPAGTMPDVYTGGMTPRGLANMREFVSAGGVLVAMDRAADLAIALFNLPIRDVTAGASESDFYIPGSILKVQLDPSNPVGYGMPAEAAAFFINSPAFEVTSPNPDVHLVASYPPSGILMSGWALGDRLIANRAAVIEAKVGAGQVVLLGFPTQHRGQPHGTFKLLFNSIFVGATGS